MELRYKLVIYSLFLNFSILSSWEIPLKLLVWNWELLNILPLHGTCCSNRFGWMNNICNSLQLTSLFPFLFCDMRLPDSKNQHGMKKKNLSRLFFLACLTHGQNNRGGLGAKLFIKHAFFRADKGWAVKRAFRSSFNVRCGVGLARALFPPSGTLEGRWNFPFCKPEILFPFCNFRLQC